MNRDDGLRGRSEKVPPEKTRAAAGPDALYQGDVWEKNKRPFLE